MQIRTADPSPLYLNEDFILLRNRSWNILDANIALAEELCGSHRGECVCRSNTNVMEETKKVIMKMESLMSRIRDWRLISLRGPVYGRLSMTRAYLLLNRQRPNAGFDASYADIGRG